MKPYLIIASHAFASRSDLQEYLGLDPEIKYWYACLPQAVFVISELTAPQIARRLEARFGTRRFLVMEVTKNKQGRLPPNAWYVLNHPDQPRRPR